MESYQPAENISLVHSGQDYFEVLERMIDECAETFHLQTYIFETDATGLRIIDALKRAAGRGANVYVMADAYGSYPFSKKTAEDLRASGVHFRLYSPLFSSEAIFFVRRLHHKIAVADQKVALTGGINIADKYNLEQNNGPWLDYSVLVKGEVCQYLHLLCEQLYKKQSAGPVNKWIQRYHKQAGTQPHMIRYRRNDWIKGKNEVYRSYIEALKNAKHSVTIVASYFLPGKTFRKLLKEAAARGVSVRVILAGSSDVTSVKLAENYLYEFYIKNNIGIYEWKNSVMHGKAMVVDNKWATIGSYNINYLSHYLSIELNADLIDQVFMKQFTQHLDDICAHDCNFINSQANLEERHWFGRFKMWLAYGFHKLLMNVLLAGRNYQKTKRK